LPSGGAAGKSFRVSRQIYKGRIVDLRVERVTLPNGHAVDLELMHHPGASAVAAVDEARQVVLIRQYRHAAGGYIWELPAGVLASADEAPADCAARELREETGLVAGEMRQLGTIFTTPGFCDERMWLFRASGLTLGIAQPEADERIEMRWFTPAEVDAALADGTVCEGKTLVALLMEQRRRD